MKKVNLRDLYPDVYKTDHFVEVTEDVLETIRAAERAEAAYDRRMYRYKAHYSLDCDNGIENAILMKPQTPEMLLEEKQLREQIYAAVMTLPEKQAKRIYARYYLGMRVSEIAAAEGGRPKSCSRQHPAWVETADKVFLKKFRLVRSFFALFVRVNKKDKFSTFNSTLIIS